MGQRSRPRRWCRGVPLLAIVGAVMLGACAPTDVPDDAATPEASEAPEPPDARDSTDAPDSDAQEQRFPDVLAAELAATNGTWRLSATLSSPYDTPERYADAFRALDEDGTVLGVRELAHDHANEQPFTRSLSGLAIPEDVERITVQGRDQRYGWGGATVEVEVPSGTAGRG